MRFGKLHRIIVLVPALLILCATAGPAAADFIPADIENIPANIPAFVQEFRAFLADFPRWDAAHLDLPLVALAMTPEQQRPQMLLVLWDLWMHDQPTPPPTAFNLFPAGNLAGSPPPGVSGPPRGGNGGGGTISSTPGLPEGGGGTSGSPGSAPEPSSLALVACGSLGLLAYRFVRLRRVRGN